METITAFPLQWPPGQTRSNAVKISPFKKKSFEVARRSLSDELKRLGAKDLVLSTNVPLRNDGNPSASHARPKDHGVAVYFKWKNRPMVFACDRWSQIECNMHSIELTIGALRGIDRWGSSEMMERAFTGFAQLEAPGPKKRPWWEVLECPRNSSKEWVNDQYKELCRKHHPDRVGGSHEAMTELNQAREEAQKETA